MDTIMPRRSTQLGPNLVVHIAFVLGDPLNPIYRRPNMPIPNPKLIL